MFGYDSFAIEVDGKIYAEIREGMYMIALSVYGREMDLEKQQMEDYKEELDRYNSDKIVGFKVYDSLEDYANRSSGDVLFFCTPTVLYIIEHKTGVKTEIISYLRNVWDIIQDRRDKMEKRHDN
jgi:hypothetical protein